MNLLARSLYAEFSELSSWPDMHAGAWAMVNRIRPSVRYGQHRYELGSSLAEVLGRRGGTGTLQFSFMPRGGVNASGGSAAWRRSAHPETLRGSERKAWELSLQAAREVLGGAYADPTGGAIFYHHGSVRDPWWRTLRRSPYRSPQNQNFFYQAPEDADRPTPRP